MKFKDFDELMKMVKGKSNRIISPGANNATFLLIGGIGGPLTGYMTGGRSPGDEKGHLVLEIGPAASVPPEVVR